MARVGPPRLLRLAVIGTVAVLGVGLSSLAPASATLYGGPECQQSRVEAHPGGSGNRAPVAHDDTATVSEGRGTTIDVLANDTDPDSDDLEVIALSRPAAGVVCLTSEGDIYYYSLGAPDDGVDTFSYAVTDGDYYRTATVTMSIVPTAQSAPVVTTRLRTSGGEVIRKGEVSVTNPDPEHTIMFYGAAPGATVRDIHRTIAPGATTVVATSRSRLAYETVALGGEGSEQDYLGLAHGVIDTVTGTVTSADLPVDTTVPNDQLDLSACYGFAAPRAGDGPEHAPSVQDDTATAADGIASAIDVLGNDVDRDGDPLTVVAAGTPARGFSCASGDDAYYLNFGRSPSDPTDSFTYTVSDGDRIRTARVRLDIAPILSADPEVTRTIQVSHGAVVRKGQVKVSNPDRQHAVQIFAGPSADGPFDIRRQVAPGGSTFIDTSRSRLFFRTLATVGDRYETDQVTLLEGAIDTTTGKVTITYRRGGD